VAVVTGSYLVGTMPVVYLLGRRAGVDLRRYGSGNVGSHNLSAAGRGIGVAGWLSDAAKGAVAVLATRRLFDDEALAGWSLLGALAGQCWPAFLGWSGGRGVATLVGGMLTLTPRTARWPLGTIAAITVLRLLARTPGPISTTLRGGAVPVGVLAGSLIWPLACAFKRQSRASTITAAAAASLLVLRRISANGLPKTGALPTSLLPRVLLDRDHW
jgi:glycerol-3-phosphate acyltransferase PlsY